MSGPVARPATIGRSMNLFIFGIGYSALHFARQHRNGFVRISGTVRDAERSEELRRENIEAFQFNPSFVDPQIVAALQESDDIIISIPPDVASDPVLKHFGRVIATMPLLRRVVYLSTVGVYGDHQGQWIDETTLPRPASERSKRRLNAERNWTAIARARGFDLHILRLAGIYGPDRNAIANLREGKARRIVKKDQVFNRIHVEDIARTISACLARSVGGETMVWNVTDNEPAPPQDVVAYAANLIGVEPPPAIAFEDAEMTPMARSFYGENKRVSNRALREDLGVELAYPTYREGIASLVDIERAERAVAEA